MVGTILNQYSLLGSCYLNANDNCLSPGSNRRIPKYLSQIEMPPNSVLSQTLVMEFYFNLWCNHLK